MLTLTATELPRFMACNGSKLLGGIKPFNPSTEQTDEGNAAHWLAEQVFKGAKPEDLIDQKAPNGLFITPEMVEYCREYFDFIKQGGHVEFDTSHSGKNWEIRGRADYVFFFFFNHIVADLKYGWRIVEPQMNWTLISHAIACVTKYSLDPSRTQITFKIFQPRAFHPEGTVREWSVDYTQLMDYWKELDETLSNPSNKVCTSSHCYKCPSITQCPAAQISAMNAVDLSQRAFDSEIDNETLSWLLSNLKRAQEVLKQSYDAYQDLALHRLSSGQKLKGFAAKQALGITTWNDNVDIDFIKSMSNIDISVRKMMSPAQAKKAGVPEELLKLCTHRPDNGIKLVQVDENKLANKLFGRKGD